MNSVTFRRRSILIEKFCSLRPHKSSVVACWTSYILQGKVAFTRHFVFVLAIVTNFMYFYGYEDKGHKTRTSFCAIRSSEAASHRSERHAGTDSGECHREGYPCARRSRKGFSGLRQKGTGKADLERQAARPTKGRCLLKNSFVLDTSALLALRSDESGADRVEALLSRAKKHQCRLLVLS